MLGIAACIGNAIYAVAEPGGLVKFWSPGLVAAAMIAFLIVHGSRCYGGRQVLRFAGIVFLTGWFFETISIVTGFPFGHYHYTDSMKPFLGHVPVSVMPAYCVMGYVSWSMARIVLNRHETWTDNAVRFAVPVTAAFFMVLWDVSMDPLRATVEQRWIWLDGGSHLGVPLQNYLGWALVTWIMFQCFAVSLARRPGASIGLTHGSKRLFWLSVPVMYAAFAVEYVLNPFTANHAAIGIVWINGAEVPVENIFDHVALLAAMTMLPAAALAAIAVHQRTRPTTLRVDRTRLSSKTNNASNETATA